MRTWIVLFLISFGAMAQHAAQPEKESTSDLRSSLNIFSIEDTDSEKIYWLERTANLDYFLRLKDDDDESIRKVDSRDAKKLEMDFASRFLKIQYELPASEGKCEVTLRLSLKGESQEVCKKDDKKTQEIKPFLDAIGKRF